MSTMDQKIETTSFVVAGCKPWNREVFEQSISRLPGHWAYVSEQSELTMSRLHQLRPRMIFFLHWSWKVPQEVLREYECVCFHMTDVPFGRGGSPLQHLILRGMETTKLSALRMTEDFDAGPVYMKREMPLNGSAEEIYKRSSVLAAQMIEKIVKEQPTPVPQVGAPTIFKRRHPSESRIPHLEDVEKLYDYIRMLDAEGYPRAYIEQNGFRYELRNASMSGETLIAEVRISKAEEH